MGKPNVNGVDEENAAVIWSSTLHFTAAETQHREENWPEGDGAQQSKEMLHGFCRHCEGPGGSGGNLVEIASSLRSSQ